jgi:hypothetical protein
LLLHQRQRCTEAVRSGLGGLKLRLSLGQSVFEVGILLPQGLEAGNLGLELPNGLLRTLVALQLPLQGLEFALEPLNLLVARCLELVQLGAHRSELSLGDVALVSVGCDTAMIHLVVVSLPSLAQLSQCFADLGSGNLGAICRTTSFGPSPLPQSGLLGRWRWGVVGGGGCRSGHWPLKVWIGGSFLIHGSTRNGCSLCFGGGCLYEHLTEGRADLCGGNL